MHKIAFHSPSISNIFWGSIPLRPPYGLVPFAFDLVWDVYMYFMKLGLYCLNLWELCKRLNIVVYLLLLWLIVGVHVQCMTTNIWLLSCVNYYIIKIVLCIKMMHHLGNALQCKKIEIVSHYFYFGLYTWCILYHWLLSLCVFRPVPWLV